MAERADKKQSSTPSELRSRIAKNAKRGAHALSERLEHVAASRSGQTAKIASRAAELVQKASSAIVVDEDAMERLGRPGEQPAERQSAPYKETGDPLSPNKRSNGARKPGTRDSREAIERAENEGMVRVP